MYLWKRENGFTFQQRIPASVESKFGKSLIRVNLGPLSAADARKRAIILSGAAIQLMDDPDITRETLVHSLRVIAPVKIWPRPASQQSCQSEVHDQVANTLEVR